MKVMDKHGNINAEEGCTLCCCGAKYWENDVCVSCGTGVEISQLRVQARNFRYMNQIWLNVQFTSMMVHDLGITEDYTTPLDLLEINKRFNVVQGHVYGGF